MTIEDATQLVLRVEAALVGGCRTATKRMRSELAPMEIGSVKTKWVEQWNRLSAEYNVMGKQEMFFICSKKRYCFWKQKKNIVVNSAQADSESKVTLLFSTSTKE